MSGVHEQVHEKICRHRREGQSFDRIVQLLDDDLSSRELEKRLAWGSGEAGGVLAGRIPILGQKVLWPVKLGVAAYRLFVQWYLSVHLSKCSVIVEVGCGAGINAVLLGRTFPEKEIIATDYSEAALSCVRELADVAGAENVMTRKVDLTTPNLDFLEGSPRVGIFACGVLCTLRDGGAALCEAVDGCSAEFEMCIFEPISDQMGGPTLLHPNFKKSVGLDAPVWPALQTLIDRGASVVAALPDFVGYSPLYSFSLVHLARETK